MDSTEQAALNKAVQDALAKVTPAPTPPVVTPVATTLDWTKLIGIILAAVLSGLSVYHQQTTDKPVPAPTPIVAPADPAVMTKLVGDVADLQARVKVLETPVKK
jgi:hypothetical protein